MLGALVLTSAEVGTKGLTNEARVRHLDLSIIVMA